MLCIGIMLIAYRAFLVYTINFSHNVVMAIANYATTVFW